MDYFCKIVPIITVMNRFKYLLASIALCLCAQSGYAQKLLSEHTTVQASENDTLSWYKSEVPVYELLIDSEDFDSIISNPARDYKILPPAFLGNPVYGGYKFLEPISLVPTERETGFADVYQWLDDLELSQQLLNAATQNYMIGNPERVRYNLAWLPEPPKQYRAFVNPTTTRIEFEDMNVKPKELVADIERKVWLGKFTAALQFSQAYISPNWYQGGNNNLNILGQFAYNLKLNQQFYPKYLFDMTVQYKIGVNQTPDDSIRSYAINEDLLQFNLTAGLKAWKKWFYSASMYFKTQLFNSYPLNSHQLRSAFLSPGELNVGVGMTYNHENEKKTFSIAMSIAPASWNIKTCINRNIDETIYGIKAGRKTSSEFGANLEMNLKWKIAYNISYASRLFAFTDYKYFQSDWEHTIDFAINKYLSTRLYLHMRYDTQTPRVEDSRWHKFQFKEILSIGFNYTFGAG